MEKLMSRKIINLRAWGLAIRPRTLPAAATGVIIGSALAWRDGLFQFNIMLICLLTALLLQIGSNLANDVFDFERGTDTPERLGPTRVTQAGLLKPEEVKFGMTLVFGLAILMGLYLVWLGGWPILLIGVCAIVSAIAYTGGPFPIGYRGLGEVFVFIFFGLASVAGTYYLHAGFVSPAAWWMTISPGLMISGILVVNNLRDLENDRKAGKYTLAVRLGEAGTKIQYLIFMIVAYLVLIPFSYFGMLPWSSMLVWLSLPFTIQATKVVLTQKGSPLNAALAQTGVAALTFSVLFWLGLGLHS